MRCVNTLNANLIDLHIQSLCETKLALTSKGNHYCITLTDYFSKCVEATPIPTKEAKYVTDDTSPPGDNLRPRKSFSTSWWIYLKASSIKSPVPITPSRRPQRAFRTLKAQLIIKIIGTNCLTTFYLYIGPVNTI